MKSNNPSFYRLLLLEIFANLANEYDDNYNEQRFGKKKKMSWRERVKLFIKKKLGVKNYLGPFEQHAFNKLAPYLDGMDRLYETLSDQQSKTLLVQLATYRVLGYKKYKLPLSNSAYFAGIDKMIRMGDSSDYLEVKFVNSITRLYKFDLNEINVPIKMYYMGSGVYNSLFVRQYEYIVDQVRIKPEEGDIVLDCGACWGGTALFFANDVGKGGYVYSFEFVPENIEVFNANIGLNPDLKSRVTLVPHPLREASGKKVFYIDNGPGSRISVQDTRTESDISSLSIDDFYEQYAPEKIDFIKMDIEGSELPALKGALSVLKKFRPKLAISIYHSMDDFVGISQFLDSLGLGYEFYLKHGTIHKEETVLFGHCSMIPRDICESDRNLIK